MGRNNKVPNLKKAHCNLGILFNGFDMNPVCLRSTFGPERSIRMSSVIQKCLLWSRFTESILQVRCVLSAI